MYNFIKEKLELINAGISVIDSEFSELSFKIAEETENGEDDSQNLFDILETLRTVTMNCTISSLSRLMECLFYYQKRHKFDDNELDLFETFRHNITNLQSFVCKKIMEMETELLSISRQELIKNSERAYEVFQCLLNDTLYAIARIPFALSKVNNKGE